MTAGRGRRPLDEGLAAMGAGERPGQNREEEPVVEFDIQAILLLRGGYLLGLAVSDRAIDGEDRIQLARAASAPSGLASDAD